MKKDLVGLTDLLSGFLLELRQSKIDKRESTKAPVFVVKMVVAARLLAEHGGSVQSPVLTNFGHVLLDLLLWAQQHPDRCPARYDGFWAILADFLEDVLERCDQGDDISEIDGDPQLTKVITLFVDLQGAGSEAREKQPCDLPITEPLTEFRFLDKVENLLSQLPGKQTKVLDGSKDSLQLRYRWSKIRTAGDALFDPENIDIVPQSGFPAATTANLHKIVMLVSGSFRSDALQERLQHADLNVIHATAPEQVIDLMQDKKPISCILSDDVEPTRHLKHLLALFPQSSDSSFPRIVLVSGAQADVARRRARKLGLAGVWMPPFSISVLLGIVLPD